MKEIVVWLITIVVFFTLLTNHAWSEITEGQISLATDYAMSGLNDEAKQILIPLLHDSADENLDPRIRFLLGSICLFQELELECVNYHWSIILRDAPNSPSADAVRNIRGALHFFDSTISFGWRDDVIFRSELMVANRLWRYKPPDYKMKWKDIKDARLALSYLDMMLSRHADPRNRAIILMNKFLLQAGYNHNNYGFKHASDKEFSYDDLKSKPSKAWFKVQCEEISQLIKDIPEAQDLYIETQFLLGVMHSGSKFLSTKIKLKKESIPYFEEVMASTERQVANPYRIFTSLWLNEYYNKHEKKERDNKEP